MGTGIAISKGKLEEMVYKGHMGAFRNDRYAHFHFVNGFKYICQNLIYIWYMYISYISDCFYLLPILGIETRALKADLKKKKKKECPKISPVCLYLLPQLQVLCVLLSQVRVKSRDRSRPCTECSLQIRNRSCSKLLPEEMILTESKEDSLSMNLTSPGPQGYEDLWQGWNWKKAGTCELILQTEALFENTGASLMGGKQWRDKSSSLPGE